MAENASLELHLHPLPLISISDQVVRARCAKKEDRIVGALIGSQEGRRVDIYNSYELIATSDDAGELTLDREFWEQRSAQYLEVFPKYEFLGWYTTGTEPRESDKKFHKTIQEVTGNENPFLLLLDTTCTQGDKAQTEDLPVKVYDAVTQLVGGEMKTNWNPVHYEIDTLEAERIAADHVSKTAKTAVEGYSSDFSQHVSGLSGSLVMLNHRVKDLLQYLESVKAGTVPKNHEVLRQLLTVCEALRSNHPEALRKQFYGEFNDASLVVHLSTMTKTCSHISDLIDKFQLAHHKKHRQHHHYPFG